MCAWNLHTGVAVSRTPSSPMPAGKSVSQSGLICPHRQIHLHLKHFVAVFAAKVFSSWRDALPLPTAGVSCVCRRAASIIFRVRRNPDQPGLHQRQAQRRGRHSPGPLLKTLGYRVARAPPTAVHRPARNVDSAIGASWHYSFLRSVRNTSAVCYRWRPYEPHRESRAVVAGSS
jgi:hypothetical protein